MSGQLDRKLGHAVLRRRGLPFLMSSSVAVDRVTTLTPLQWPMAG